MESNILTKTQLQLLEIIGENSSLREMFYLTGGTALAGFYLKHRHSEDLDFFSEQEFDASFMPPFFKSIQAKLGIISVDIQQSFNRNLFFLHLKDEIIKTEFTYFPFPRIEKGLIIMQMQVDSILDIAVNKLFTIYQKPRARDYIDLYCILSQKGWSMEELIQKARIKFDWHIEYLQLGAQFIKAADTADLPRMIKDIPESEWRLFFSEQAKILQEKVLK